ncbi:MAG TPA: cupredoxin family copper-binding protein [Steroidobacteraceae bacterium]|jgi:plastocyanin
MKIKIQISAVLLCAIAACLSMSALAADAGQIQVKDFMFTPSTLTVSAGSKVTWVNKDDEPHTVVSDSGMFRSAALDTDESFSFTFDKPGTYHFTCSIHPRMVGTIVVK